MTGRKGLRTRGESVYVKLLLDRSIRESETSEEMDQADRSPAQVKHKNDPKVTL